MDILSILKGLDKKGLDDAVKKAQDFSRTDEGRKIVEKLKSGESINGVSLEGEGKKIMEELGKNPEVLKKLKELLKG